MKKVVSLAVVLSGLLIAGKNVEVAPVAPVPVAPANIASNGFDLKVGTLGLGVDFEHMFNKKHALRVNINGLKVSKTKNLKGIDYDLDLKLLTAGVLYDYHPWKSSFRLTTGLYYNKNKITGHAEPTASKSITIGDKTYTASDKVSVDAKIDFKKVAPYIGIGWSSTEVDGWHFTADIGVMYHGTPKVSLKSYTSNANIRNELESETKKEEQELYDKVKKYKWYPVIAIGIQKKF
jgi:hypothetical protein